MDKVGPNIRIPVCRVDVLDNENCNLVTHIKRFLIALSNYEKNKIEIGLLLMAYHKITFDYGANPVMLYH